MMAGVHQGKPRAAPDITKLIKQRDKITEFLKQDKTKDDSVDEAGVNRPAKSGLGEQVHTDLEVNNGSPGKSDVFCYEGVLTIMENDETDQKICEADKIADEDESNEVNGEEGTGNSAQSTMNDLKNTINEVFWNKINSHVEDLLNTYESDTKTQNPANVDASTGPRKTEQPQISCQKLNNMTRKNAVPKCAWPKNVANSKVRSPCHRKSMLEISSTTIDDNLISIFRRDMHCTDACVIRVVDKSGIFRQSHVNRTIPMVCIDRSLLQDNVSRLKPDTYLRIIRMENVGSIAMFQSSDVFAKRSVIKGGDILRTLAVYEIREKFDFEEQHAMDKETRKVMYNKFTNMQRLDRGVGSRLKWQFMERHNIEETDTIECLEEKADVSFSIFGVDGYLSYESKVYRMKHVSMIKDHAGLYYFIPQKMLSAFGSQWNRRYRSDRYFKSKIIKSEENCEISSDPIVPKPPPKVRKRAKIYPKSELESPIDNEDIPSTSISNCDTSEDANTDPVLVKPVENFATAPLLPKVPPNTFLTEMRVNARSGKIWRKSLLSQRISDSKEILPNDGMSWRKIRDGKSLIHPPVRKSSILETDDPVMRKEQSGIQESSSIRPEFAATKPSLSSLPRPPFNKPPEIVKAGSHISSDTFAAVPRAEFSATQPSIPSSSRPPRFKNPPEIVKASPHKSSDTFAAVPRASAASIPTVRLLPLNAPRVALKRSSDSQPSPNKRITSVKNIGVLNKNHILTKGEVLLTTKDHIIFRIPRNVEQPESSEKSSGDQN